MSTLNSMFFLNQPLLMIYKTTWVHNHSFFGMGTSVFSLMTLVPSQPAPCLCACGAIAAACLQARRTMGGRYGVENGILILVGNLLSQKRCYHHS